MIFRLIAAWTAESGQDLYNPASKLQVSRVLRYAAPCMRTTAIAPPRVSAVCELYSKAHLNTI